MDYKMLALDLDGTLLDEDNAINEQTQRSVEIVREKGLKVIIATGRMFCSALPYHRQLGLEGPLIAYNGAYVKHVENDELIFHRPVELEMARQIIRECEENNLHVNLYQDDNLYMEQADSEGRAYERASGVEAHYLNSSLSGFISKPPTKLLIIEKERRRQQHYLHYFQEKYRGQLEVTESKKYFIEISAPGVSKGKSLGMIADRYGLDPEEIMVAGDGWNDYTMFQKAGFAIAMETAPEAVKQGADRVAPPNTESGLSRVLQDIFGD